MFGVQFDDVMVAKVGSWRLSGGGVECSNFLVGEF